MMNGHDDKHDTLPALAPHAPDWAHTLYDMMLRLYQRDVERGREFDTTLLQVSAELSDHERRIGWLEHGRNGDDTPTNPGE